MVVLLIGGSVWWSAGLRQRQEAAVREQKPTPPVLRPHPPESVPTGNAILRHYAAEEGTVEQDLRLMAAALDNFALLVKGDEPLRPGANEEIAATLQGKNRVQLRFLSADTTALNSAGQLVDRWGTPLFFHARDHQRIDIRSAGPDRQMWTDDDVHRLHDGQYLRGDERNAPSLYEASEQLNRGK